MTLGPFGSVVGAGIPSLATPAGSGAGAMGAMLFGLLMLTAVVLVAARRRHSS